MKSSLSGVEVISLKQCYRENLVEGDTEQDGPHSCGLLCCWYHGVIFSCILFLKNWVPPWFAFLPLK